MKYVNYQKLINKYKNTYGKKIKQRRNYYENNAKKITLLEFKKLNDEVRWLIINLIIEILDEFKPYFTFNFLVGINGSLARGTNTLYSDVDINYLTDSKDYDMVRILEDKINYIIEKSLGFKGKDKIHSMVVYLPLVSNNNYKFIYDNKYPIYLEDKVIYNKTRVSNNMEDTYKLMFENYNSTRNIYDVINYFNMNDTSSNINEWCYCFNIIYSYGFNDEFFKSQRIVDNKGKDTIDKYKNKRIKKILEDDIYLDSNIDYVVNKDLKLIYKSRVLFNFYEFLAIYYNIDKNIDKFNITSFIDKGLILDKELFNIFYEYLRLIQDLQLILDKDKCDLSIHFNNLIDIKDVNKKYFDIFGKINIIDDLNNKKKELYDICLRVLRCNYE